MSVYLSVIYRQTTSWLTMITFGTSGRLQHSSSPSAHSNLDGGFCDKFFLNTDAKRKIEKLTVLLLRRRPNIWKTRLINELWTCDFCPVWFDSSTASAKVSTAHTLHLSTGRRLQWIFWRKCRPIGHRFDCHILTPAWRLVVFSSARLLAHCRPLLAGMLHCCQRRSWVAPRGLSELHLAENGGEEPFLVTMIKIQSCHTDAIKFKGNVFIFYFWKVNMHELMAPGQMESIMQPLHPVKKLKGAYWCMNGDKQD